MKDYLKCSLTKEEEDLIIAIIWITAKDYKKRLYKGKNTNLYQLKILNYLQKMNTVL